MQKFSVVYEDVCKLLQIIQIKQNSKLNGKETIAAKLYLNKKKKKKPFWLCTNLSLKELLYTLNTDDKSDVAKHNHANSCFSFC